jgi:hypothetical protein
VRKLAARRPRRKIDSLSTADRQQTLGCALHSGSGDHD